ncbi:MAG: DUF4364 family protein [Lachnospiraceae bacterium]|nr:DUF4364 family protein [Lachnospiraceae bacterium]
MTQEPMTLYKLIVLYMLDRVTFPLTRAQIDAFILEKEYTNYLTLQQAIGELHDIHLISSKTVHNRTQLMLTEEGRSTLDFFRNNIPEPIKKEINVYLKENSIALRNEVSVTGQYYRTTGGSYQTLLSAMERGEALMELKLTVPDEKTAASICDHWQKKNEDIYALLMKELF